ncbi:MAG: ParB/RepB/Spo0J family partition protein [Thermoanaerobaculaceae bacterium]|jgi:ParB family chromosome partitioning protein|nr:ParB/RepB/Spo0J family partition protein [Thermoanaerobaculaceae bacterium]
MKRPALGKGIAALIPEVPPPRRGGPSEIPVSEIRPSPLQPRRQFSQESLAALAASIREHGVLQPVIVTRAPEGGYHLVAGERRWRAAREAGLERIPAVVRETSGDLEMLTVALIENLQREDLTPLEEARAFHHLRADLGLSQEEIARRVGRDRSTVANSLRLLHLPLEIQELVETGALSAGHARALAGVADHGRQLELARRCVREGWSVREVERRSSEPHRRRTPKPVDPETAAAAERLSLSLGARVEIVRGRRGGQLRIHFRDEQELIRLFRSLTREKQ